MSDQDEGAVFRRWSERATVRAHDSEVVEREIKNANGAAELAKRIEDYLHGNPMTMDEAKEWLARTWGCACVGGPHDWYRLSYLVPCFCALQTEASLRALEAAGLPLPESTRRRLP